MGHQERLNKTKLRLAEEAEMAKREDLVVHGDDWTIEPLQDYILVEETGGEMSQGGIVIPENARGKAFDPHTIVVAAGPGRMSTNGTICEMRVKVGDRVLIAPTQGTIYKMPSVAGRSRLMITEPMVIGIAREKPRLQ